MFAVGHFAAGIQAFEFSGDGFGAGIAIFLEGQSFAREAGEGVDEARECVGLVLGILGAGDRAKAHELIQHLGGSDAQASFVEAVGIRGGQDFGGELGPGGEPFEPIALAEPILVTALFPVGDVRVVEGNAAPGEGFNDEGAGRAIGEHLIELVPLRFRQLGDFAVSGMSQFLTVRDFVRGQGVWIGGLGVDWFR